MKLSHGIAVTGSIGSGKSTLLSLLALYGYKSVCADSISHNMLEKHKEEVVSVFGSEILDNNKINRKKLGNIVFNSESQREKLQSILHPHIRKQLLSQALELEKGNEWYFLDIPLFFETGGRENYPVARSLVIYTPAKQAIERIMKRDNLTHDEAKIRLNTQMPIEEKCRLADDIIGNDGGLSILQQRVESYLRSLPSHKPSK